MNMLFIWLEILIDLKYIKQEIGKQRNEANEWVAIFGAESSKKDAPWPKPILLPYFTCHILL